MAHLEAARGVHTITVIPILMRNYGQEHSNFDISECLVVIYAEDCIDKNHILMILENNDDAL